MSSEPETPQKVLVAVAWPYASGPRHLGHVAGPGVPSDVFARYHRLKGNDVLMVSGSDEHGTPVMVSADREGVTPRELADRNNALILDDYVRLGMTYDCFTRTTTRNHYAVVQDMFRTLYDKGFLIEQTTLGAIAPAISCRRASSWPPPGNSATPSWCRCAGSCSVSPSAR